MYIPPLASVDMYIYNFSLHSTWPHRRGTSYYHEWKWFFHSKNCHHSVSTPSI